MENEVRSVREENSRAKGLNPHVKVLNDNSIDILNSRISELTMKFQKFLQKQAETIKKVEKRKGILSSNKSQNSNINEFTNGGYNEEEDVLLNMGNIQKQEKKQSNYYQRRLNEVQTIEKTMSEISSMMNRLSQMTYEHSSMIEHIDENTRLSYENVEKGSKEVESILAQVQGNRCLLIKIFVILIVTAVAYILLF